MRGAWGLGSLVGLAMGWACGSPSFTCSDDEQCQPGGGTCVEGYCAFPSDECGSGLQWGDYAGPVSGTCVPEGGSGTDTSEPSTGPAATDDPADPSTSTLPPLDTSADGTSGPLPGEVELRDDALRGEFGAGVMRGVEWTGDRLALSTNAGTGTFTSRVYDAGEPVTWHTVQWQPDGPYGKPLPDGGQVEEGYPEGGADMTANVLLMHLDAFDGQVEWPDETVVLDASGTASHGVVESVGPVPLVPGVFGTALDDQWESRIEVATADAPELAFGTDDFTWALWVRMDSPCTSNHVYMGVDDTDEGVDLSPHLWLGCTDDPWPECETDAAWPRAGGVLRSVHDDPDDGGFYCSPAPVDGDVWHHLAVVKAGHDSATISLYVDGVLVNATQASFAAPIVYPNDPAFTIGALSRDTYRAVGVYDEVAIWRRALPAEELAGAYQRGATSLGVSVRVCQLPGCADDPPWGPTLVDPPQALVAGSELPLEGMPVGQYAQYRLEFAGEGGAPALRSVTVRGLR